MNTLHAAPQGRGIGFHIRLCLWSLCLILAGCGALDFTSSRPQPQQPQQPSLAAQADKAWNSKDHARSQELYQRLAHDPAISPDRRTLALRRLVLSALENGNHILALNNLPAWRRAAPDVVSEKEYQDAYIQAVLGLDDSSLQETELLTLSSDESLPWRLRARAGITLAVLHWSRGDVRRPLMILPLIWKQALAMGGSEPGFMEATLFEALPGVRKQLIDSLQAMIPDDSRRTFPYTIAELEKARRMANSVGGFAQGVDLAQRIKPYLENPGLVDLVSGAAPAKAEGDQAIALALPLTGPYGEVASMIMRGALAAQRELADQDVNMDVRVINTETATWTQELRDLPDNVVVIGGPLRIDRLKQALGNQLNAKRAFFAFLPTLSEGREGHDAWRFFASPEDQVNILVESATQRFGVYNASVLYPDESFGRHMAELFEKQARSRGITVASSQSYPPTGTEAYSDVVSRVLAGAPQAVFIPGDWSQAEQIAPFFAYHDAKNVLLMGPSLWAQTISRKGYVEMASFSNSVFPGPWWPQNPGQATATLRERLRQAGQEAPDFWNSLGFDFVRFAAQLGALPPGWSTATVNERIRFAQSIQWSQAPIEWSAQGVASQQLFLFRATAQGFAPIDSVAATPPLTGPGQETMNQPPTPPLGTEPGQGQPIP
jgi:uncharacterized protein